LRATYSSLPPSTPPPCCNDMVPYLMWEPAMSSVSSLTSCQWSGVVNLSFPITVAAKGRRSLGWIIPDTSCCVGPNWCRVSPFLDTAVSLSLPVKLTAYFGGKLQHITRNQSLTHNVLCPDLYWQQQLQCRQQYQLILYLLKTADLWLLYGNSVTMSGKCYMISQKQTETYADAGTYTDRRPACDQSYY